MKTFRIILVSFLFITACQLQKVKKPDDLKEQSPNAADSQASDFKNTPKHLTPGINPIPAIELSDHLYGTQTAIQKPGSEEIFRIESGKRRIAVPLTDAASRKLLSRKIPGIEWVQQIVDMRTILKIQFENDLITYANTDRYFTNGITFDLQAAWLAGSPLHKLMIPYRHNAFVTHNFSLVQDMYTPTDTRVVPALKHNRPYSSVLYLGLRRTFADPVRKIKLSSGLNVGYIGPYSLGSSMQEFVHRTFPTNDKPLGWETQINSDIILNYNIQVQKALIIKDNLALLAGVDAEAGTLYTNAGVGLQLQAGKADPFFGLTENKHWPKVEYYFFAKSGISFVAYNALLQGGVFNQNNIFTLNQNEIQHVVGNAEAGIHFRYKGIGMEIAQHFILPEYKGGLLHKWGRISLIFKL